MSELDKNALDIADKAIVAVRDATDFGSHYSRLYLEEARKRVDLGMAVLVYVKTSVFVRYSIVDLISQNIDKETAENLMQKLGPLEDNLIKREQDLLDMIGR